MNIVICGCGNVGFEVLKKFVKRFPDAKVFVYDKCMSDHLAEYLKRSEAKNVYFTYLDMSDHVAVAGSFDRKNHETIDILISTVGIASEANALDDFEGFKSDFDVNFFANLNPIRSSLMSMMKEGGKIVVLLSSSSMQTPASLVAYAPAKWALLNFCSSLRSEMLGRGISVIPVVPGNIINRSSKSFTHTSGMAPEVIADHIVNMSTGDLSPGKMKRMYCFPKYIYVIKLLERLFPNLQDRRFGLRSRAVRKKTFLGARAESVLITGASRGLGKGLAYAYAKRCKELHLLARSTAELEMIKNRVEKESSCKVSIHTIDLSDFSALKEILVNIPNVDIIINNAGYAAIGRIDEMASEEYTENFAVNLFAPILIISEFMKRSIRPKKVINVLSTTAIAGRAGYSAYSSTKGALWAFTRAFRRIYGDKMQVLEVVVSSFENEGDKIVLDENVARYGFFKPRKLNVHDVVNRIESFERNGKERLVMPFKSKMFMIFEALFPTVFQKVFS